MDTNKENELMQNLERQIPDQDGHLPDGRPAKPGAAWGTVNSAQRQQGQSQASRPLGAGQAGQNAIDQVTPEMVNRMEAYGTEAVYDARQNQ